jgi:hypothetical protein
MGDAFLIQNIKKGLSFLKPNIVTSGLVFYVDAADPESYSGSGNTWTDMAGNINGTINNFGTGVTHNSNVGGGVMQFNGVNGSVSFPNNTALNNQNFTMQVWTRPNAAELASSDQQGFWFEKGYVNTQYALFIEEGVWKQRIRLSSSNSDLNDNISRLSSTQWQMVTATKQSTTRRLYYNTSQVQSTTTSGTVSTNNNGMFIGAYHQSFTGEGTNNRGYTFNGDISVVLVYNRELTSAEVTQNFNAIKERYGL